MKVTVTKYLNVRVGSPSVNAPCYQYLAPGSILEVDGQLYQGDKYNDIATWLRDEAGNYYWSGGVSMPDETVADVDYKRFVSGYNYGWLSNGGNNSNVALIDTGITLNGDYYANARQDIISATNSSLSHGNFIGGILCGKKTVKGLCDGAALYSIKYKSNGEDFATQMKNMILALQKVLATDAPLIVNISQGFSATDPNLKNQRQQIAGLVSQIAAQGNKLIVCSAGDNRLLSTPVFPAVLPECISVGAIDTDYVSTALAPGISLLSPMNNYTSFDNAFNTIQNSGSSFCTAMISAMAACYVAEKGTISKSSFLNELKTASVNRGKFQFDDLSAFQYEVL